MIRKTDSPSFVLYLLLVGIMFLATSVDNNVLAFKSHFVNYSSTGYANGGDGFYEIYEVDDYTSSGMTGKSITATACVYSGSTWSSATADSSGWYLDAWFLEEEGLYGWNYQVRGDTSVDDWDNSDPDYSSGWARARCQPAVDCSGTANDVQELEIAYCEAPESGWGTSDSTGWMSNSGVDYFDVDNKIFVFGWAQASADFANADDVDLESIANVKWLMALVEY